MTKTDIGWDDATRLIQHADKVLVVAHLNPDGDAIGSLLGLGIALNQLGKTVTTAVDDGVPKNMRFLPTAEDVQPKLTDGVWDLMVAVDCGDMERTGEVGKYGTEHSQQVINIDHHRSNTYFGDVNIVIPTAVSATEILYHWLMQMGVHLQKDIALPLLTGLATDTLGLRTSNVTAGTLEIAQRLMEAGASLTEITARTLDSMPYNTVRMWKHVFPSIKLKNKVISAEITHEIATTVGASDTSDGGLVSLLNQVDEAMIAVVFKEKPDKKVNISIRSKPGFDVGTVAVELGGGGHSQASGATVDGTLQEVRNRVLPMLQAVARQGKLAIV